MSAPIIPGLTGHLVSASYLARRVAAEASDGGSTPIDITAALTSAQRHLGPASSVRSILEIAAEPLLDVLGYQPCADLVPSGSTLVATTRTHATAIVVLIAPWGDRLDSHWRAAITAAQERSAPWCLLFNGTHLRVVDAGRLYSRRSAEFDLSIVTDFPSAMAALRRLTGSAALGVDRLDPASLRTLVDDSDRDAASVCRSLRDGVLTASADVLSALVSKSPVSHEAAFDQALTIVYRIVFLLFAEARALVPVWHPVYRESYSVESLRQTAERSVEGRGLWEAIRAIGRLAHAGCHAGDLRVTPFNGRLFAPGRTPLAERRGLNGAAARRAVLALSTRSTADRAGRERIAYGDLGVEQLGAVYETLLDYRPRESGGRTITLERGSGLRKSTGSFYTPQTIADFLARRTLGPLVHERTAEQILELRVVDPAMGSGACLVAACRFLAAAYEQASIAGGDCHASDIGDAERTMIRRRVVERCLYGVDLNPMAVQLARLSLWLTSLAADRPLSFLDHRLAAGDSLLGAWLSTLRQAPRRRRMRELSPLPLFDDATAADALQEALPVRFSLESIPSDTIEQVRTKERALAGLTSHDDGIALWRRIADLWCAVWFDDRDRRIPATAFGTLADAIRTGASVLPAHAVDTYRERVETIAAARRFFHWELEFPEVFFAGDGRRLVRPGFDAVVGNPPWDMMRADAGQRGAREEQRADVAATVRFTRDAGIYQSQSDGHANRYQLFVERAMALTRAGGRIGLVLPWGLAADHGSALLRRQLLTRCAVDALVGVDNQHAIFPIHRSTRFLLLTATAGPPTDRVACRFGVTGMSEIEAIGETGQDQAAFPVQLTPTTLERLSGASLAVPYLQSSIDLTICEKAAALFPPLGGDTGWCVRFGRELNATDDREAFQPIARGLLPVVDGRHVEPFRVAAHAIARAIRPSDARRRLGDDRVGRPRLAYRDVASATNRMTLIAAILPARTVSTHTVFCLRTPLPARDQHFLCGLFNSLVVNYFVRLRVTTHVTTAIVEQLPIPTRATSPAASREIAAIARLLARRPTAPALATLNALAARLYQLSRAEFEHVLGTFPLVPSTEREAALKAFVELR